MKRGKVVTLTGRRRVKPNARRRTVRRRVAAPAPTDHITAVQVADALLQRVLARSSPGVVAVPAAPLAPWLQELMRDPDGWARRVAAKTLGEARAKRKKRRKK